MCTQCSLQCLMQLTQIIGPVCSVQSDKRLIIGCAPKMKPSPSIGGMSLGMDQQPYDKHTARPTNSRTEERGRHEDRRMLTREERPCVGLAVGKTQDYSSWGDLFSSCNTILRCRRRQWSLLSYSSSTSTTNISITNKMRKMCNRMTAMAIIQSYKYVKRTTQLDI